MKNLRSKTCPVLLGTVAVVEAAVMVLCKVFIKGGDKKMKEAYQKPQIEDLATITRACGSGGGCCSGSV